MQSYAPLHRPAVGPLAPGAAAAPAFDPGSNQAHASWIGTGEVGIDDAPADPADPAFGREVRVHLANHAEAVAVLRSLQGALPPAHLPRAADLVATTSILAGAVREDLAALEAAPPGEGGALRDQLAADAGDLADGVLLLDAYRMLAEETHRLRITAGAPALVALFGAPVIVGPSLEALGEAVERVRVAREEVRAAATDLGETAVQLLIQLGLEALITGARLHPVTLVPVTAGKLVFDNWIDARLGSDAETLPHALTTAADLFVDDLTVVNRLNQALTVCREVLVEPEVVSRIGAAVSVLDAGVEGIDAADRLIRALTALQALGPEIDAAREQVREAFAAIGPVMEVVHQGIGEALQDCARTVADAALLVESTEAELGSSF